MDTQLTQIVQKDEKTENELQKNVGVMLAAAPPAVRAFLTSPERDVITAELSQKHKLDAKQAPALGRDFILMLLGVLSPLEFRGSLMAADISAETTDAILKDINERVFMKLLKPEEKPAAPITTALPAQMAPSATNTTPIVPAMLPQIAAKPNFPSTQMVQPPAIPILSKNGVLPPKPVPQALAVAHKPAVPIPTKPLAPNSTPLINKYVADPYHEPIG